MKIFNRSKASQNSNSFYVDGDIYFTIIIVCAISFLVLNNTLTESSGEDSSDSEAEAANNGPANGQVTIGW